MASRPPLGGQAEQARAAGEDASEVPRIWHSPVQTPGLCLGVREDAFSQCWGQAIHLGQMEATGQHRDKSQASHWEHFRGVPGSLEQAVVVC